MSGINIARRLRLEPWQRTVAVVVAAEGISLAGFGMSIPFLPYFIQELGVTDLDQVAFWVGFINSGAAIAMALAAPLWGMLSDRYGRKPMLVRSLLGGGLAFCAIGLFAQNVQHLAAGRILQATLAGSVSAATTLVATSVPREQCGVSLGLVQTAVFIGNSLGPFLGGIVAAMFGYRMAFVWSGVLVLATGVLVILYVHEDFQRPEPRPREQRGNPLSSALRPILGDSVLLAMLSLLMLNNLGQSVTRPVLPLFVQTLVSSEEQASTVTGLVLGLMAMCNAISAVWVGRMADRLGRRRVLIGCLSLSALFYAPQIFTRSPAQIAILCMLVGLSAGGLLPTANAIIAERARDGRQGSVYGLSASLNAVGRALGPMLGTLVTTQWWVGGVFPVTGLLLACVAVMTAVTTRSLESAKQAN